MTTDSRFFLSTNIVAILLSHEAVVLPLLLDPFSTSCFYVVSLDFAFYLAEIFLLLGLCMSFVNFDNCVHIAFPQLSRMDSFLLLSVTHYALNSSFQSCAQTISFWDCFSKRRLSTVFL